MSQQRDQLGGGTDSLHELRSFLKSLAPGPVPAEARRTIETLLSSCWDQLECDGQEGMQGYKLKGRMEKVRWKPPRLIFVIARHYGIRIGSDSEELQKWAVNIENGTSTVADRGSRRLGPALDEDEEGSDKEVWFGR